MSAENYLKKELYELIKTDEKIFDFLQDSSLDGMWYWDLQNPEAEWMNPKFWTTLGYNPEEMPHESSAWQNIINPEDLKLAALSVQKHCENSDFPYDQTVRYTHKNGETVWIRCRGLAIRNESGQAIRMLGAHQNVTDYKKMELSLEYKNTILEAVNELHEIFLDTQRAKEVFDKALSLLLKITQSEYGFIGEVLKTSEGVPYLKTKAITNIAWNDSTLKFYKENAPTGLEFTNLETLFGVVLKTGKPMIANQPGNHPKRGGLPEGHPPLNAFMGLPIYVGAEMIGMVGISNRPADYDEELISEIAPLTSTLGHLLSAERVKISLKQNISDKKKNKEAHKESEFRLSLAVKAGGVGIWDFDLIKNSLSWDDQMFKLYGLNKDEFSSAYDAWVGGVYHLDQEKAISDFEAAITGKAEFDTEFRVKHPNGDIRHIRALATVIRDESGKPLRMIGTNWDITKEIENVEQIKKAKDQAEQASKSKSEFLANMSHEIRTPLNGVIGFTNLLKKTQLTPTQEQYVKNANVSGQALLGIVNDILDFSKIESGMLELEFAKTDMVELFESSIDIVRFNAEKKGVELLLDIDPLMPRFAHVDPVRFQQILANLLGNAVKFTSEGEVELTIKFKVVELNKAKYIISVRDTGIGITEEQKQKLFKVFSQADSSTTRKFGGTGLGLAISQVLAEKMQTKILIDSTKGKGSTFYFELMTEFEHDKSLNNPQIKEIKRCLVIDNNVKNDTILKKMLQQWNIESDFCGDGLKAVKKLESRQQYDAVICDYEMPDMNGIEVIHLMQKNGKIDVEKTPVILLKPSIENLQENSKLKELGVKSLLNKPVKASELYNCLNKLHQEGEGVVELNTHTLSKPIETDSDLKVIIAEDNELNMFLSKNLLHELLPNCEIIEASNGLEAIEKYKSYAPSLILMDVQMPILDGVEATKEIRTLEIGLESVTPIIALTAGALKEEKENCFASGMNDFLTKPLDSSKVREILIKYLKTEKHKQIDVSTSEEDQKKSFDYEELVKTLLGDEDIAQRAMSISVSNTESKIQELEQSVIDQNFKLIHSLGHNIRGSALSMRYNLLANIAGEIEIDAQNKQATNMEALLNKLKEEWVVVKKWVELKTLG